MTQQELLTTVQALQEQLRTARQQVSELEQTVDHQRRQLEQKERQVLDLLQALRGKRRERIDPNQLLLFAPEELQQLLMEAPASDAAEAIPAGHRRKRRGGRRLLPDDLPREDVLHELPESARLCPVDGLPMPLIRYEVSEQLEYTPATLKVLVHKRAVYACPAKHDASRLVMAPKPPQPIDKGLAGAGLLAALVVGKFGDHLPGYRWEDILSRHGALIRRGTIYDWLAGVADRAVPLYDLLRQRVLASKVIHTDDTSVKLIDPALAGTRVARFWAYLGDRQHPYVVYEFTESRQRAGPQQFLQSYQGYLQADAYGGYNGVYLAARGAIQEVACWAHCRRYWYQARDQDAARAHHVLAVISRLYDVERAARDIDSPLRQALRVQHAAPLLADLQAWLDQQEFLPKSAIGQAATYTRNQWEALNRYLTDGDLSIDNNAAERAMRPVAIGRKNWLFVGSPRAGRRAAVLMSLVASCKANHVEPWAWLRDVLTQLPLGTDPAELLPDLWRERHPQHRWTIADKRQQERKQKGHL